MSFLKSHKPLIRHGKMKAKTGTNEIFYSLMDGLVALLLQGMDSSLITDFITGADHLAFPYRLKPMAISVTQSLYHGRVSG